MVARSNGRGKLQPVCADGLVKFTPVDVRRDEWRWMILGHIDADCLQQLSDGELECCAHIVSEGVYSVSLQVASRSSNTDRRHAMKFQAASPFST